MLEGKPLSQLQASDLLTIDVIAWLCPYVEGNAVYRARGIMQYVNDNYVDYINECELVHDEYESPDNRSSMVIEGDVALSVFPNPTTNKLTVLVNEIEGAKTCKMYSSLGELMFIETIPEGVFEYDINVSDLDSGTYYLLVIASNGNVLQEKITIVK